MNLLHIRFLSKPLIQCGYSYIATMATYCKVKWPLWLHITARRVYSKCHWAAIVLGVLLSDPNNEIQTSFETLFLSPTSADRSRDVIVTSFESLFKNVPFSPSFCLFPSFQTNITILTTNQREIIQ